MADQKTTAKTSVLLEETRIFEAPKELAENSNVMKWMKEKGFKTEREMRLWCSANYIQFWGEMAKTYADWFEPWASTLEWKPPYARWFVGGKCNVAYNCVDRHAQGAKKDKVAYIFVPEPVDQPTQKITYAMLEKEVNKFANGLKSLGVQKGDRVMLYMPMIPQLPIAMLAIAKIGAIHCIVFSGFSSGGLNSRIMDAEAKVVITVDGFYRRGKPLALKPNVDEATANTPSVQKVVVYKRTGVQVPMKEGKIFGGATWWPESLTYASARRWMPRIGCSSCTPPEPLASPRVSSTSTADIASVLLRLCTGSSILRTVMSGGAQLISDGSPATHT